MDTVSTRITELMEELSRWEYLQMQDMKLYGRVTSLHDRQARKEKEALFWNLVAEKRTR